MVNASLNWASIVGIVLAVCGGGLYFLRSFKPALARDYDVFFAAIGLLCGGILFFQGWRLDPILQFGQFLLAGTTVFFAYESVRLRGVATDQARRSSYFEDDQMPDIPRNSRGRYEDEYDKFENPERISRRFKPQEDDDLNDDFPPERSRRRSVSRAIPESALSRRRLSNRESSEFGNDNQRRRSSIPKEQLNNETMSNNFGKRRITSSNQPRRGSRPSINQDVSRQSSSSPSRDPSMKKSVRSTIRSQTSREKVEDASFQNTSELNKTRSTRKLTNTGRSSTKNQSGRYSVGSNKKKPRDNSSRFDD